MIGAVALFSLLIALTLIALPYINLLSEPETQQIFKSRAISLGVGGWLVVSGIQIMQIIIAFIPGEPIEIFVGVLYGGFGGLLICLIRCAAVSSGIFLLSKKFCILLVTKLFEKDKLDELKDSQSHADIYRRNG